MLLRIKLPEKRTPIGRMDRINISLLMWTSFVASRRFVVRCRIRVPTACRRNQISEISSKAGVTDRETEMKRHEENGELEVEGVV